MQVSALLPSEDSGSDDSKYSDSDDDSVTFKPQTEEIRDLNDVPTFTDDPISTAPEEMSDERGDNIADKKDDDGDSSDQSIDFTQQASHRKKIKLSPSESNDKISSMVKDGKLGSSGGSGARHGRLHGKSIDKLKNRNGKLSRGGSSKEYNDTSIVDLTQGHRYH